MRSGIEEFDGEAIPRVQHECLVGAAEPSIKIASDGHSIDADKATTRLPSARKSNSDGGTTARLPHGHPDSVSPSLLETIDAIRAYHRERNFAMDQRKRIDLALGSYLRMALGWRKDAEEADRKRIAAQASVLIECGEKVAKEKPHDLADTEDFARFQSTILAAIKSREPWDAVEKDATKAMERLAKELPVWEAFGKDVRGFGARSLAVIVGEAGDLSNYPEKGHLWKRMGLAVMGDGSGVSDIRQGGLKKSAKAEDWIAHGYNAKRRSQMYVIGDVLVKVGDTYRKVYLDRKEYERAKATERGLIVAPAAKIPAKRASEFISDGHIHKRAQRYMEKRLLKDLWQAWRAATTLMPKGHESVAAAAEILGRPSPGSAPH